MSGGTASDIQSLPLSRNVLPQRFALVIVGRRGRRRKRINETCAIAVIILPFPLSPSPGQFYTTQSVCVACLGGGREGRRWVEEPYAIVIHVQAAAARLLTPTE